MDVYQGRFQDNGFSGYVLKPEFLRDEQTKFNPKSITEGTWGTKKKLLLKVRIEVGKRVSSVHLQGGCVGCTFSFSRCHLGNVILTLFISHCWGLYFSPAWALILQGLTHVFNVQQ